MLGATHASQELDTVHTDARAKSNTNIGYRTALGSSRTGQAEAAATSSSLLKKGMFPNVSDSPKTGETPIAPPSLIGTRDRLGRGRVSPHIDEMSLFRITRSLQPRHPPDTPKETPALEPITQGMLEGRDERLVVILGPAGSGKSVLLEDLAHAAGAEMERAAFFVEDPNLAGPAPLFIDGCDEVGLAVEERPVGEVRKALKKLNYPAATITCRGIDWNNDSDPKAFKRAYGDYPFVLELLPFTREDALRSLTGGDAGDGPLDQADAESMIQRLDGQDLSDFYTNPLNLEIIAAIVAKDGMDALPKARSELFAEAGRLLCQEHREGGRSNSPLAVISEAEACDAVGLLCLAAVLSGQGVIARERGQGPKHTPTIPDLEKLAITNKLSAVLQSRLFRPNAGEGLLMPVHKMVGDYLAAQWLIRRADGDPRRVRRIMRSLAPEGLPSADRRALWAWLAGDPAFAPLIVETDPVSALHYGDPDRLSDDNMVALLDAMARRLSEAPGRFSDDRNLVSEFAIGRERPKTRRWLKTIIFDDKAESGTRVFALDLAKSCPSTVDDIRAELLAILQNPDGDIALRLHAASLCRGVCPEADWDSIVRALLSERSGDAARMAGSILRSPAAANLSNDLRAEIFLAVAGAQPEQQESQPDLVAKTLNIFNEIPTKELGQLLEAMRTHPWWEDAVKNYPNGQVGHELSRPISDVLHRLAEAGLLAPEQLATWWNIAADANYPEKSLDDHFSTAWSDPEFRRATALHVIRIGIAEDGYNERRYEWLERRLRAGELDADDMMAILREVAANGDIANLSDFDRDILAHFAYNGEQEEAAQILDAAMAKIQGLERWTHREWTAPPQGLPEWQIKENARTAKHQKELKDTQTRLKEKLSSPETRHNAARTLANIYFGAKPYSHIPKFKDPQTFRDYLGEEPFAIFRAECERCLANPAIFSVDKILESEPGTVRRDGVLAMVALWERLAAGEDFSDLTDEARAAGWFAATMADYGPHQGAIQMEGEREELQAALQCPPDMIQNLHKRFVAISYDEFHARNGLLDAVIPDAGGDRLAFETGLAWLRSAPERLPDQFSNLLVALRSVNLSEAEIDCALARLATELRVSRIDLPKIALRTLEAIRFLHDSGHPVPVGADTSFLSAIYDQLDYYTPNVEDGHRDRTIKPRAAATLFRELRAEIPYMADFDRFEHPNSSQARMMGLLNGLREDPSDESKEAIETIEPGDDSWTEDVRDARARQQEAWARAQFVPLGPEGIAFMVDNTTPQTADQMHDAGLEALEVLQDRLRSSSEDLATAYDAIIAMEKKRKSRENALNAHTTVLLSLPKGVQAYPEFQMERDSRADIALTTNAPDLLLPIEAKGQWNSRLYTAVWDQLGLKYAKHWKARGRGIYLVYWLGAEQDETRQDKTRRNQVCKPKDRARPGSPEALKAEIEAALPSEMRKRITVFVLNVTGN